MTPEEKFWSQATLTDYGCMIWRGSRGPKKSLSVSSPYRHASLNGQRVDAHRLAYVFSRGVSLDEIGGKFVRHRCDNPPCVRPDHLELGTRQDNVNDMTARGRAGALNRLRLSEIDAIRAAKIADYEDIVRLSRETGIRARSLMRIRGGYMPRAARVELAVARIGIATPRAIAAELPDIPARSLYAIVQRLERAGALERVAMGHYRMPPA